VFLVKPETLLG
jgi:putative transposase